MKRFILQTSFMALLLLLIVVFVNYFGDAARLFDNGYVKKMTRIINSGKYVTNITTYDERLFEREMAKSCKRPYDVLVLGSSRTRLIGSDYFKNERIFNCSVSGGTMEDMVAIYQMYRAKNMLPAKILLCVDPWLFNKNVNQAQWQTIYTEYSQFFTDGKVIHIAPLQKIRKYTSLWSRSYFQSSLKTLYGNITGANNPRATLQKDNITDTKLTDGSITYADAYRNAPQAEVDEKARKYITNGMLSIKNYNSLSPEAIRVFDMLVNDCKKRHIVLEFFLPPYHPMVFAAVKKMHPVVLTAEDYVLGYAAANNIKVYGSYNPEKLGLNESYFFDGAHANDAAMRKLVN